MLLKENEILYQELSWTVKEDAITPDSDVKVVSPFFSLNTSVDDDNTFQFAVRQIATSGGEFQTTMYCYVHNAHKLGIKVYGVQSILREKLIQLNLEVEETVTKLFKSEAFLTRFRVLEKGFSLRYRLHLTNISDQPSSAYLGYELRDTCCGEEMWAAAQKGVMTDCEFVVQDQTFQAHRAIVASRSPVLAERIGHENNNRIEIRDVTNPIVFKALLYFLYTGQLLPLESAIQLQFVDLATNYQVKAAKRIHEAFERGSQSIAHHSQEFSKLILDIQSKLKYDINVKIKDNCGSISIVGRGMSLTYSYKRCFTAKDTIIAPETFRFEQGGFLGVTLLKTSTDQNGHNYQLTCSAQVLSGFKIHCVTYSRTGIQQTLLMTKVFEEDRAALKLFQGKFSLPHQVEDYVYSIHIRFVVYLTETDDRWGYRLHDPSLPSQLWSASKEKLFTDVEIRLGDKTFHAHRAILSARSPVFAAMFENEMSEFHTGIVEIKDTNADVFEDFLEFLYTGRLRTTKKVEQLWIVANKYDVKTLERVSEPYQSKLQMDVFLIKLLSSLP